MGRTEAAARRAAASTITATAGPMEFGFDRHGLSSGLEFCKAVVQNGTGLNIQCPGCTLVMKDRLDVQKHL
jgi:hypothetical protein